MAAIELLCREFAAQSAQFLLSGKLSSEEEAALDSTIYIVESIEERLIREGMLPSERTEIRQRFLEELLRLLLSQANTVFNYPHSEAAIENELIPTWLRIFKNLERPIALRDAFFSHYKQAKFFPYPSQISGLLPQNACQLAKPAPPEPKEQTITPGFGKEICQKFREKSKIIRFADYKNGRLPLLGSKAAGE